MITRLIICLIMVTATGARSQQSLPVSVREVDAAPETMLNRNLLLSGIMSVLKQDTTLLSSSGDTSLDAYVTFTDGWRSRSSASAVRLLDHLRRQSKTRFPHRGVSVIELDFKSADVVLEGRLITNPDLRPPTTTDSAEARLLDVTQYERRFTAKYQLEVNRIVRLKEHHWPKKPPNKSLHASRVSGLLIESLRVTQLRAAA
jgi:hypothetical protein